MGNKHILFSMVILLFCHACQSHNVFSGSNSPGKCVVEGDSGTIKLSVSNQDFQVVGNNNRVVVSGTVQSASVDGNNNIVDIDDVSSDIICSGNHNTILLPYAKRNDVTDSGTGNQFHYRKHPALNWLSFLIRPL